MLLKNFQNFSKKKVKPDQKSDKIFLYVYIYNLNYLNLIHITYLICITSGGQLV